MAELDSITVSRGLDDGITTEGRGSTPLSKLFGRTKASNGCLLQEEDDLMTVSFIPKRPTRQEPSLNG
ncbi:hypothetical protein JYU34_021885 [Plutella xylostella]|uniref:Uncharacterized protein n=1 Tax=Plutella xylostella TaxID=51655 RepID=A0ABQ7PRI5_PLUXY|nr:hypothetical protein JYU34_021885 [Plutella xylostella]